jgi:hypothetical protein
MTKKQGSRVARGTGASKAVPGTAGVRRRRLGLQDITNRGQGVSPAKSVTITLLAPDSLRMQCFPCFADGRVFRGLDLSCYRIEQTLDNDCDTDEEQAEEAVSSLREQLARMLCD